ncbi:MAG: hypothetical protein JWO13_185 [Acidobacteriales bacterium]|nr:hypothetical protein [Terriglobales bacterium]
MYSAALRRELSQRNLEYAKKQSLVYCESYGSTPTIAYPRTQAGHGNFYKSSYKAIVGNAEWSCRFNKVHSQRKALPVSDHGPWKELDSSNSSDALLMNVFCYPGVLQSESLRALLNIRSDASPQFGVKARVPLKGSRTDQTEVDMRLDDLLVESKLTETGFQTKRVEIMERYRDFREVFEVKRLPQVDEEFMSYQLIRNVLAAYAMGMRFCVMLDARRPDLREAWHSVQRAVIPAELRVRCLVLTWQELSATVPPALRKFLNDKYGIAPV